VPFVKGVVHALTTQAAVDNIKMVEEVEESMLDEEPSPEPEKETSCDLSRALLANILSKQNAENVDSSQISHLNLDRQRIQSELDGLSLSQIRTISSLLFFF
jgi:hypothetical protein